MVICSWSTMSPLVIMKNKNITMSPEKLAHLDVFDGKCVKSKNASCKPAMKISPIFSKLPLFEGYVQAERINSIEGKGQTPGTYMPFKRLQHPYRGKKEKIQRLLTANLPLVQPLR